MQADFAKQDPKVVRVFIADHNPETAVLGKGSPAGVHPPTAPGKIRLVGK